jgi:hypothetical protein
MLLEGHFADPEVLGDFCQRSFVSPGDRDDMALELGGVALWVQDPSCGYTVVRNDPVRS